MCAKVICTIINAIYSADRQTKLTTINITLGSSKRKSDNICVTFCVSIHSANTHAELVSIIKPFDCSKPLSVGCTNSLSIDATDNINTTYYCTKHISFRFSDGYTHFISIA